MLAAIERLTIGQRLGQGIHGLDSVVAVDAALSGRCTLQPITMEESTVTKERADLPAVDVLVSGAEILIDLGITLLHAQTYCGLLLRRKIFPDARELRTDFLFLRSGRGELQRKVEILKEVRLHEFLIDLREVAGWGRRGRGLFQVSGERLRFVTRLYLDYVRHVVRVEELSAKDHEGELRGGAEDLLDARSRRTLPIGAGDQVVTRVVATGPAADVPVVECVAVAQLYRVVTVLLDCRNRHHDRFGTQVRPQHGIRRVAVGCDDGCVLVCKDASFVVDLIERCFVLAGVLVHAILVHHRVVHHDRQTVDEAFFGDRFGFGGSHVRSTDGPQHRAAS